MAFVLIALPAQGDGPPAVKASPSSCPKGAVCLWTKVNFTGRRYVFSADVGNFAAYPGLADNVESVKKKRDGIVVLYAKKGGRGSHRCFESRIGASSLGAFNNSASSLSVYDRIFSCPVNPP